MGENVNISGFLDLANQNNWTEFDRRVIELSEDLDYLKWTEDGLKDRIVDVRDLAISLLEHTSSPIFEERIGALNEIRDSDENLHLRRKAAITLFTHKDRSRETIEVLQDAYKNDPELKEQVKGLLDIK